MSRWAIMNGDVVCNVHGDYMHGKFAIPHHPKQPSNNSIYGAYTLSNRHIHTS